MYRIEKKSFGFQITQSGSFDVEDVERYSSDLMATLAGHNGPFSLLIDSRELVLPAPDVLEAFSRLHQAVWQMSCERTAIVVKSPVARAMVVQARSTHGYSSNDRIIDARKYPDWQDVATAWAADGVEPPTPALCAEPNC
jgi:hypothetical protein